MKTKSSIFVVLFGISLLAMVIIPRDAFAQNSTVKAVEECVDNKTQCLKCGGECVAGCCDNPVAIQ